ncbi:MAG: hypothetical protein NTX31_01140 [Burkholderiales bacterium]|nr:hypothetical protein [Burkholderiales bacterium]
MPSRHAIRVLSLLLATPCFAGDLEDGVRLYDQRRYAPSITAFEKAAAGGNAQAQRAEAAKWWTLAMMNGGTVAEMVRRSVESAQSKLTPEQNAEGERRAQEWQTSHQAKK